MNTTGDYGLAATYFAIHEDPSANEVTAAVTLALQVPTLQSEGLPSTEGGARCVILCLDKSGSMAGSYFESLKKSAIEVCERAFGEGFCETVYTIFYSGSAALTEYKSLSVMRKSISKEVAGGMTNFSSVYEQILRVLLGRKKKGVATKELNVLFFTDGLDTVNPKGAVSGIKEMQEKIALNGVKDSQFFSVGFSGDHDA